MTVAELADWFNFAGSVLVLALSLVVMRHHRRPYFTRWVWACAGGVAFLATEVAAGMIGRAPAIDWLEVVVASVCCWLYADFGQHVRGKALPPWTLAAWVLAAAGAFGLITGLGHPFMLGFLPCVVAIGLTQIFCGGVFLVEGRRGTWQAWPQILLGLWVFMYPVLQPTPYFWVGYLVSALLHVLIGTTMLLYLLQDVAAQLALRNDELEQAAAHKQTFLGLVSHELRTPLAAILGFRELLEDEAGHQLLEHQRGYLAQIQLHGQQLTSLIDAMLDTFQLEHGTLVVRREPVDLAATLEEALAPLRAMVAGKGQELEVALPADLPLVLGDPYRIGQVVTNLVSNAAKFTDERGRIGLAARRDGAFVRVELRDTGVGIHAKDLTRVFEPFFQADASLTRSHNGSGLGLAIVRELVWRMGGRVGVASEPHAGSLFWFTLPVAGATTPRVTVPAP